MGPALTAVEQAQAKFNDPQVRAQVKQWYADGLSFLDMLRELGIATDPALTSAIANLEDDEIAIIRDVMLKTIDANAGGGAVDMPIDCDIEVVTGDVDVTRTVKEGVEMAKVTPEK